MDYNDTRPSGGHTPLEAALLEALKDVRHVGDYGKLWVNEPARRVHLTMGDSDGDTDQGLTGFDEIAALVWKAVKPFWPDWFPPEGGKFFEHEGTLVIGDEWSPDPDGPHGAGWVEVGAFGREVTEFDNLPKLWRDKMLSAGHTTESMWAFSDSERLRVAHELERLAAPFHKAALELVRPLVQEQHATDTSERDAAAEAIMEIEASGNLTPAQAGRLRKALNGKGIH